WVKRDDHHGRGEFYVARRREYGRERILDPYKRIAEWAWRIDERLLRAERRHLREAGIEECALARVPEDSRSAAETGSAVTEQIVGEAEAWRKEFIVVFYTVLGDTGVTGEEQTGGSVEKLLRLLAGIIVLWAELFDAVVDVTPR